MPTCAFITLGCKVNQYDTQSMREALCRHGFAEVDASAVADLYVLNTCCVTHESHRKCLRICRRIGREHPDAAIAVVGCGVEFAPRAFADLPGVVVATNNDGKPRITALVAEAMGQGATPQTDACEGISSFEGHTRAFVKIEDGCNDFCSYCIVPHVRGRVTSRPPDDIAAEVERLVHHGYVEIVLTGIHMGCYGLDSGGKWQLVPLIERLVATPGLRRLRLSSLEVREVTDDLLDLMAASPVLCPHLHIPLQSGDDDILHAMNRHYTAAEFLDRIAAMRARIAEPAISADILVGFPGETDAQFRHTIDVVRAAGFTRTHVFPYSDRPGTPAATMDGKVAPPVIKARRTELLAVGADLARAYHERFVGREIEVLVEHTRDRRTGHLCGYSERYVRAYFDGPDALMGTLARVRVLRVTPRGVAAEPCDP